MSHEDHLLTDKEIRTIGSGSSVDKDYFYIPLIYYSDDSLDFIDIAGPWLPSDESPPASLIAYRSKVAAGTTLRKAIAHDLEHDFWYAGKFDIERVRRFDTAETKDGRTLTRVLVWVNVESMFEVHNREVLGMQPEWREDNISYGRHYSLHFQSGK